MITKVTRRTHSRDKSWIQSHGKHVPRKIRSSSLSTAELAECTCPDFCERDHANE
jgi:hypothetical protein